MRPVHIIGVSLDLVGNRRGVDMGPSAFRIAGIGERLVALGATVVDAGDLVDPGVEIQRLQASQAMALSSADTARRELDDLRQALADAVPGIDAKIPAAEATRLRMRKLIDAGSRGSGLPPPAHRHLDPADIAPSRAELQEVAEGRRSLTREEREWCVTEAMVLCGFTRTPVELLADGEPAIARILLEGQTAKN